MSENPETDRDGPFPDPAHRTPGPVAGLDSLVTARGVRVDVLVRRLSTVALASPATPHGAALTLVRDRTSAAVVAAAVGADAPSPEAMAALFEHARHPEVATLWTCPVRPSGIVVDDDLLWSAGAAADWSRDHGVRIDHPAMWPLWRREPDAWMDRACREIVAAVARRKPPLDHEGRMRISVETLAEVAGAWRHDFERRPWPVTGIAPSDRWRAILGELAATVRSARDPDPKPTSDRTP
ncbi:hypothetical protein [Salinarimonas soli]|uniref:Uncharacterized protein n=1 Tax=Salinarimonas soli TaxID=1638099 RepID=A0A5B2VC49_9HYPH|nr:hypothetical protein [Salinarimonas soli]KAA2235869.1 hypothetical protein F0L46_17665 [Salinarimonas soli]